jgi:hypothetical protein
MAGDGGAFLFGDLAIQIVVDLVYRFGAVHLVRRVPLGDQRPGPVPVAIPRSTA